MKHILLALFLFASCSCKKDNAVTSTNGEKHVQFSDSVIVVSDTVIKYHTDTLQADTVIIIKHVHDTIVIVDTVYGLYAHGNPVYPGDPIFIYVYPDVNSSNTQLVEINIGGRYFTPDSNHAIYPGGNIETYMDLRIQWTGDSHSVAWTRNYFDPFVEYMPVRQGYGSDQYLVFPYINTSTLYSVTISDFGLNKTSAESRYPFADHLSYKNIAQ